MILNNVGSLTRYQPNEVIALELVKYHIQVNAMCSDSFLTLINYGFFFMGKTRGP